MMFFDAFLSLDSVASCVLILFYFYVLIFLDEKAEVAMAVLPLLLKPAAKEGLSQQQDFVHFIPVSK